MNQSVTKSVLATLVLGCLSADATPVIAPISTTGAIANQNNNPYGFPADRALDGNTSGVNPDFSHTAGGPADWWNVAFPEGAFPVAPSVDIIRVYNRTDCCAERLNGAVVNAYSDLAKTTNVYTSTPITGTPQRRDFILPSSQSVRVVQVDLTTGQPLSLAEVQFFGKANAFLPLNTNLTQASMQNLVVSQSSTLGGYSAGLAIDNNTGNFTHTASTAGNQWWKAHLGELMAIQKVEIFNRGGGCCPERMRDITVEVLDAKSAVVWTSAVLNPGNSLSNPPSILLDIEAVNGISVNGFQVRVTRTFDPAGGSNDDKYTLSLGEVTIIGGSLPDTDNDGMPDAYEDAHPPLDKTVADASVDADSDFLTNLVEYYKGTLPNDGDTDNDLVLDGYETGTGVFVSAANTGTDPFDTDSDNDTLLDAAENGSGNYVSTSNTGTNPNKADSDADFFNDQLENDSGTYVDASNPGTDPNIADTDGDGVKDGLEAVYSNTNPTKFASRPLRSGLVDVLACWDFNDDSNPSQSVDAVKGFVGVFENGAAYTVDGGGRSGLPGDKAIDFGANQASRRMRAPGGALNIGSVQDEISFVFWQKLSATPQSTSFWAQSPRSDGGRGAQIHLPWVNSVIYWDTGGALGTNQRTSGLPVGNPLDYSVWRHMVVQKKGLTKEVWIDGILVLSGTVTGADTALTNDFTELLVGCDQGANQIIGLIDDFTVYADALSPADIAALNLGGAAGNVRPHSIVPPNLDTDGDGMPDVYENTYGLNPASDDSLLDLDTDLVSNISEYLGGTLPNNADTDGDLLKDGWETNSGIYLSGTSTGTNPLDADSDNDGFSDGIENPNATTTGLAQPGTNPNLADSDNDGWKDYTEVCAKTDPKSNLSVPVLTAGLDLLAYWSFNNTTNPATALDEINCLKGDLLGAAAYTSGGNGRTGKPGDEAVNFGTTPGANKILVSNPDIINLAASQDQITVSFWQKLTAVESTSAFFGAGPGGSRWMGAHVPWGNGFYYWDTAGVPADCCNSTRRIFGSTNGLNFTQWHHFAFVKNGSAKEIWVDGAMVHSGTNTAALLPDLQSLVIGNNQGNENIKGTIDDFAIYGDGLNASQIARLARGETPPEILLKPLEFTGVAYNGTTQMVTMEFNSRTGATYKVVGTQNPDVGWPDVLAVGLPSAGPVTTSYVDNLALRYGVNPIPGRYFYKIVQE